MIDSINTNVNGMLNKAQLGYLKPLYFNSFLKNAQRKLYNRYFSELKSNVRKSNWMLDGRNFADYSEYIRQHLEHFALKSSSSTVVAGEYFLADNIEVLYDVFNGTTRVDKIDYSDFLDLQSNNYAAPSICNQFCSKVGNRLLVLPASMDALTLHYLRKPLTPKWTYQEFEGKPMFDEGAVDFQDVDLPDSAFDQLVSLVFEQASIYLRDFNATQAANSEQSQEAQLENRQ